MNKARRLEHRRRALNAFEYGLLEIGLRRVWKNEVKQSTPSIVGSTSTALASLLRLRRRLDPLFEQAEVELNKRYKNRLHQKRRERGRLARKAYELGLDPKAAGTLIRK